MKNHILFFIAFFWVFGLQAQYTFSIKAINNNPYNSCDGDLLTYEFSYTGNNIPDSVFVTENGSRIINTSDWSITGSIYTLSRVFAKGTYNPILSVFKNGVEKRYVLPQQIIVYANPKAKFLLETDNQACESRVILCLKDVSIESEDKNAISQIEITWGDGETAKDIPGTLCHSYLTNGNKSLTYKAIDTKACSDQITLPNFFKVENTLAINLKQTQTFDSIKQLAVLQLKIDALESADSLSQVTVDLKNIFNNAGETMKTAYSREFALRLDGIVDTSKTLNFEVPVGKYEAVTLAQTAEGCSGSIKKEIIIGHFADFKFNNTCLNNPIQFSDSVFYWHKGGQNFCNSVNWWENGSCIDTSKFFYKPDMVRDIYYGKYKGYKKPKYTERIAWDFENDGIIDVWDVHNPSHTYTTAGTIICAMWTMDSTGVWQKTSKLVEILNPEFNISLTNGNKFICLPASVEIAISDKNKESTIEKVFLNGKEYKSTGSSFHFYTYIRTNEPLKFKIKTDKGCVFNDIETDNINLLGAKTDFIRISDTSLCTNEEFEYLNRSEEGTYQWKLTRYRNNSDIFKINTKDLNYNTLYGGHWSIELSTTVSVFNPESNKNETCTSSKLSDEGVNVYWKFTSDFKMKEIVANTTVIFDILDSVKQNRTYYYSVNNVPKVLIENMGGIGNYGRTFSIDFPKVDIYEVCLYVYGQACADSTCKKFWIESLSINNQESSNIYLFPNPTVNSANLYYPYENGSYQIVNVAGQKLIEGKLQSGANELNTNTLPKGTYFVKVKNNTYSSTLKLIKS